MSDHKATSRKIGIICQNLRKSKGLSQEQMAEELGISKPTIAKLETGRVMNFKNMIAFLSYFGELERLDNALDRMIARTNSEGMASNDRSRFDLMMAKAKDGQRLNLDDFEFCINQNMRKEYPVLENALPALRLAGYGVRYDGDEDAYYATSVRFLKELKRRKDSRFYTYRLGENSDFAYLAL